MSRIDPAPKYYVVVELLIRHSLREPAANCLANVKSAPLADPLDRTLRCLFPTGHAFAVCDSARGGARKATGRLHRTMISAIPGTGPEAAAFGSRFRSVCLMSIASLDRTPLRINVVA